MINKKTLYVNRPLLNAHSVVKWAKECGFENIEHEHNIHVTIAYSKVPVDWDLFSPKKRSLIVNKGKRTIKQLGIQGAVVLTFNNKILNDRWAEFCANGCSWDFPSYMSHITFAYNSKIPLDIQPYSDKLVFGNEIFNEVNEN